jgi:hypothetical protein
VPVSRFVLCIGGKEFLVLGLQLKSLSGVPKGGLVLVYERRNARWLQTQHYYSGDTSFLRVRPVDVTGDGEPELIGEGIPGNRGKTLTVHQLQGDHFAPILQLRNFNRGSELAVLGAETVIIDHVDVLEYVYELNQASEGRVYRWRDGKFVTDKDAYLDILSSDDPKRPTEFGRENFEWRLKALKPFADAHPKHFDAQQNMTEILLSLDRKKEARRYIRTMMDIDLNLGMFECSYCDTEGNLARELARERAKGFLAAEFVPR